MLGFLINLLLVALNLLVIYAQGFNWLNLSASLFCAACGGFCLALKIVQRWSTMKGMKIVLANMISLIQIEANEAQCECVASFEEILPHRENGQREYGQSDDWRAPDSAHTAFGRFVFWSLAYHPRSVIARSVLNVGTTWKRNLSLKLSERVSHVSSAVAGALFLLSPAFFFFFLAVKDWPVPVVSNDSTQSP